MSRLTPGITVFRSIDEDLVHFRHEHPIWAEQLLGSHATYAIPRRAVADLALTKLFTPEQLAAERIFSECCANWRAVGVRGDQPIFYPLLTPTKLVIDDETATANNFSKADRIALDQHVRESQAVNERLLGVAGRLLTEPVFLEQVALLRTAWEALPINLRAELPLGRPGPVREPSSVPLIAADGVGFFDQLSVFLDRWGLISLNDWDLPLPQGPLLPSGLPNGAVAEPRHGIRIILPLHYPLLGDDQLLRGIADMQRAAALENDLPAGLASIKHYVQHAQMFRLIHLESVLRSRFLNETPYRFVTVLTSAASCELGVEPGTVKRLRNWIRVCRNGRRDTIARLRD